MSLRVVLALGILVIVSFWTFRRPFIGILFNVAVFHINPRMFGAGLENIRFQFIASIVLLLAYLVNTREFNDENRNELMPPLRHLFAFTAYAFVTCIWAVASPAFAFSQTFDFLKIVFFSYMMFKIVKTEKEMQILMWTIMASCTYTAFIASFGVEWDWVKEEYVGIATGGTGTHLVMFFPMLVLFAIYGTFREKVAAYMLMPFILNFLPSTDEGARATFLSLVTSFSLFLFFTPAKIRRKSLLPLAFGAIMFVFVLTPPTYWENMATILHPSEENSANSRSVINAASLRILADYPFGVGKGNYTAISGNYMSDDLMSKLGVRDAHNTYLKIATEIGAPGLIIWLITFVATWWYFRKIRITLSNDKPPTYIQLYALGLEVGLLGIVLGIGTHSYQDLDTLYWFVAFSVILNNIYRRTPNARIAGEAAKKADKDEPVARIDQRNTPPQLPLRPHKNVGTPVSGVTR